MAEQSDQRVNVRQGRLSEFRPASVNANKHTARGMGLLDDSMSEVGYLTPMTVAADGESVDGSARMETAIERFGDEAVVIEHDGTVPIVMVRKDMPSADDPRAKKAALYANRTAEVNLEWDAEVLASLAEDDVSLDGLFTGDELADLLIESPTVDKPQMRTVKLVTCPECGAEFPLGGE